MKALTLTFYLLLVLLSTTPYPGVAQQVGEFTGQLDLGARPQPGAGSYSATTREYTLTGATGAEAGHYVYKHLTGDFLLYARAEFTGPAAGPGELGWLVRQSLLPAAPQVSATVRGDGALTLRGRPASTPAPATSPRSALPHADVLQLERRGTTYTLRAARFGRPFETVQVIEANLGAAVYVGLVVGAPAGAARPTAAFRDVRLSVPAPAGLVSYQQYLGSRLELLDVATGGREVIFTAPGSIQAPNWRPDNSGLLYNGDGKMYGLDLRTRQATVLPTGEVQNNNDDHVLAFDGNQVGLSSGVDARGGSVVYTVPATGGTPRLVTPRGPSYLHGWSPDGRYLVFTGERGGDFDIYRVPAAGGAEVRLTTAPGLDDGPEYTPDGQYLYFNSVRTGTMQIWRMRADGSEQQPVTHGEFNDWFPHVSPDGKWVVFLSFLKDEVAAGDHPFYKHVYLRLLPTSGGEPRVIAYVYGGQGTINTPSWSPDSKYVAFISNSAEVR